MRVRKGVFMPTTYILAGAAAVLVACGKPAAPAAPVAGGLDRRMLPIAEPPVVAITELDARNAKAPPRFEVKAPDGAPNVVIVLIDDIGFGHSSAFGGPINMPTLESMAASGLKYNRFHTTALCSPTRTALLTGRNHHVNNAGAIMELATAFPGNTGIRGGREPLPSGPREKPPAVSSCTGRMSRAALSTISRGRWWRASSWSALPGNTMCLQYTSSRNGSIFLACRSNGPDVLTSQAGVWCILPNAAVL
jgi:hypothetical protein